MVLTNLSCSAWKNARITLYIYTYVHITPHFIHDDIGDVLKVTSAPLIQVQQKDEEGEFLQMAALQQNMRRNGRGKDTRIRLIWFHPGWLLSTWFCAKWSCSRELGLPFDWKLLPICKPQPTLLWLQLIGYTVSRFWHFASLVRVLSIFLG